MKEGIKELWAEHGLTIGMFGLTAFLMTGKLAFGWGIGWGWVLSPIWIPFLVAAGVASLIVALVCMVMVCVFGVVAGATMLDKEVIEKMEETVAGWDVDMDSEETEDAVETEAPVQGEGETLQ